MILLMFEPWLATGAGQALSVPRSLDALPGATEVTNAASPNSVNLSYAVLLSPSEVTHRYQEQLEKAGVTFTLGFDGIGNQISASTEDESCVVRIAEAGGGSNVRVACAPAVAHSASASIIVSTPPIGGLEDAASIYTTGSTNLEGWSKARWGMSEQQVLKVFPREARVLTDDVADRTFGPRGIATVGIDSASLGGIPLRVLFLFGNAGMLNGVRFVANSSSAFPPPSVSDDQFMRIENALAGIYGAPTLRAASVAAITLSLTRKGSASFLSAWVLPKSVIEISYIPTVVLNVSIDEEYNQSAKSILASRPDLVKVPSHKLWGLGRQ